MMDTIVTITPKISNDGQIMIELTRDQFEDINKALNAYNKKRDSQRNIMAKKRGTIDSKACKPKLVLSYPVADTPTIIPQNTTYNVRTSVPIRPLQLIINPQPSSNATAIPQINPRVPVIPN